MGALQRPVPKLDLGHFWVHFLQCQRLLYYTWASHWNYCGFLMDIWNSVFPPTPQLLLCRRGARAAFAHRCDEHKKENTRMAYLAPCDGVVYSSLFPCSSLLWLEQSLPWRGAHIQPKCESTLLLRSFFSPTPVLGHWDWKQTRCSVYSLVSLCGIGEF